MRKHDELSQAIKDGTLDGFRTSIPPTSRTYLQDIDQSVCDLATCADCGHVGLIAWPLYNKATGEYRGYQKCPQCGGTRGL